MVQVAICLLVLGPTDEIREPGCLYGASSTTGAFAGAPAPRPSGSRALFFVTGSTSTKPPRRLVAPCSSYARAVRCPSQRDLFPCLRRGLTARLCGLESRSTPPFSTASVRRAASPSASGGTEMVRLERGNGRGGQIPPVVRLECATTTTSPPKPPSFLKSRDRRADLLDGV